MVCQVYRFAVVNKYKNAFIMVMGMQEFTWSPLWALNPKPLKNWSRGVLNDYFSLVVHFSKDNKHVINMRWLANPNQAIAIFLVYFEQYV